MRRIRLPLAAAGDQERKRHTGQGYAIEADGGPAAGFDWLECDRLRLHRAEIPVLDLARGKAWHYNQWRPRERRDGPPDPAPSTPPMHGVDASIGQLVGTLVLRMPGMPFHPVPADAMSGDQPVQFQPQVDILNRLLVGGLPAAPASTRRSTR